LQFCGNGDVSVTENKLPD